MLPAKKKGALRRSPPGMESLTDQGLDLEVALTKMHELGLADGDVGYAYWHQVAELLKSASAMDTRLRELEQLEAKQRTCSLLLHNLLFETHQRRRKHAEQRALNEQRDSDEHKLLPKADGHGVQVNHDDDWALGPLDPEDEEALSVLDSWLDSGGTAVQPWSPKGAVPLTAEYVVANTDQTPTAVLQRYRIECDVSVAAGSEGVQFNLVDEKRGTLSSARLSEELDLTCPSLMLRGFVAARSGTSGLIEISPLEVPFNRITFTIGLRHALEPDAPFLSICVAKTYEDWRVYFSEQGSRRRVLTLMNRAAYKAPLFLLSRALVSLGL